MKGFGVPPATLFLGLSVGFIAGTALGVIGIIFSGLDQKVQAWWSTNRVYEIADYDSDWYDDRKPRLEDPKIAKILNYTVRIGCISFDLLLEVETRLEETELEVAAETWMSRCDEAAFFTGSEEELKEFFSKHVFGGIMRYRFKLRVHRSPELALLAKVLPFVMKNFDSSEIDWFAFARTETYFIMENLRSMVANMDPNKPTFIGLKMAALTNTLPFTIGEPGFVLSRKAMELIVSSSALSQKVHCNNSIMQILMNTLNNDTDEDESDMLKSYSATCMLQNLGIEMVDTLDRKSRERFIGLRPKEYLLEVPRSEPETNDLHMMQRFHRRPFGWGCCSTTPVMFQELDVDAMLAFHFLLYNVSVYKRDIDAEIFKSRET